MKDTYQLTEVSGYVEHIVYRNSDNGYTVMEVSTKARSLTLVGNLFYINEGEYVNAIGRLTSHPVYGEQLQVKTIEVTQPQDLVSIERYLGSGAIKGIGPALAGRVVEKFREDTFRIMEEEPERLAEVRGISEKSAMRIAEEVLNQRERRQAIIFLQNLGIGLNLALKIHECYKDEMYHILQTNPYRLAEDISGVSFKTADQIAVRSGIQADSDYRIRSGLLFVMNQAAAAGHTYLPMEKLEQGCSELLGIQVPELDPFLVDLVMDKKLVVKPDGDSSKVYLSHYYFVEMEVSRRLHDMNETFEESEEELEGQLLKIEAELDITLEEKQRTAFFQAATQGLLIVTGGPGTGKTTIIRSIIAYFEENGMEVALAAPTGRAARRMKETTGCEAKTIHRLLEISRMDEEDSSAVFFERNENNPLEADVVIVDEMSMVDINLMNSLLKAVVPGSRLILVGDVDQLPSVGPGTVLRDIIQSDAFAVVRLEKIFRQSAMSDIIINAHKINGGEYVNPAAKSKDFLFIRCGDSKTAIKNCVALVRDKLPGYVHARWEDIQILTPMRKGALGVEAMNELLQESLNPPDKNKREKETAGVTFRVGDKVMQIKNNYKLEWEVRGRKGLVIDAGAGVFNGDMGIVRSINTFAEEVEVEYEDRHMVTYSFKNLDELELAYAITVHKSQGSEYPAVVLPLISGPSMLMNRNLLYTAVTRAKSCVCIVGLPETFSAMVANGTKLKRYTSLEARIREITGISGEEDDILRF